MANYFYVALRGTTMSRLMNLLEGSVRSWGELCKRFVTNFSGSFTRPGSKGDLLAVHQKRGETL